MRKTLRAAPGAEVWVNFGDLPEETRDRLWGRHRRKLAFPAGFEGLAELEEGTNDPGVPFLSRAGFDVPRDRDDDEHADCR